MAKRIVIVGAGLVGLTCARRLSSDGHDVVVVEQDKQVAAEIVDRLDVQVVVGSGSSLPTLRDARLDQADLLLAVTDSDEVNMITALIAGAAFDVPTKVIRLRSGELLENLPELAQHWPGETFGINPDRVAADRVLSLVRVQHSVTVAELLDGKVAVAGFRIDARSHLAGKTLADLPEICPDTKLLIPAIYRGGKVLLPSGTTRILPGDTAFFSTLPEGMPAIHAAIGHDIVRKERLVVGGGGKIGSRVVAGALERKLNTTLIHSDAAEAEKLALELPDALVIHGSEVAEHILLEAGVEKATTFIAATEDEEDNLLSSVLALRHGARRAIALVDNPAYQAVAEGMGINAVVSPRLASVSAILRFVRGTHFEEVISLLQEMVEISVVEVDERSTITGRPVSSLGLPRGVLFAAVATGDEVFVPAGDDIIPPGSRVVVFSLAEAADKVARLLGRS